MIFCDKSANFAVMNTQGNAEMSGNSVVIRLSSIGKLFDHKQVLRDISVDINRGDFVAVTGPNGGGKTTLLRIILQLVRPTSGTVEYLNSNGEPFRSLPIGYLPQKSSVDSKFPITVRDVIRLGLMGPLAPKDNIDDRVAEMLSVLELEEKESSPIGMISGGQLQRTLLGRALIADPEVIVLDEPLSYLDKHFEHKLYDMLGEIMDRRPQTAIILVSHEMTGIAAMANRHLIVDHTLHVCKSASHMTHYDCGGAIP